MVRKGLVIFLSLISSASLAAPRSGMSLVAHARFIDIARWKRDFDAKAPARAHVGLTHCTVQQTLSDPNEVVVICDMQDQAKAKAAVESKAFEANLVKLGLVGKREIFYLQAPR